MKNIIQKINDSKILSDKDSNLKNKYYNDNYTEIKKEYKKIPISQISSTILDSSPQKYTLTKLINSFSNFRKEAGYNFRIDTSSIKPNRLFDVESNKTIGIKEIHLQKASFMTKFCYKNISPLKSKFVNN